MSMPIQGGMEGAVSMQHACGGVVVRQKGVHGP